MTLYRQLAGLVQYTLLATIREAHVAAINRAQTAIIDYRDVPALEEATYIVS
jgi:outer membrane protein assembly factor BamD (BamD/ComL family)